MKKTVLLISLSIVICSAKNIYNTRLPRSKSLVKKEINITYKGFFAPYDGYNSNQLLFTIQNNTTDTIYLSLNDINVEIFRTNKRLKEDNLPRVGNIFPPDFLEDITFFTNRAYSKTLKKKEEEGKTVSSLKRTFATKLYRKNFGNKPINKDFIYAVVSDCLVLLPKEKINISKLFVSKSLDSNCLVKVEYKKSGIFTTYNDENGADVKIKY